MKRRTHKYLVSVAVWDAADESVCAWWPFVIAARNEKQAESRATLFVAEELASSAGLKPDVSIERLDQEGGYRFEVALMQWESILGLAILQAVPERVRHRSAARRRNRVAAPGGCP